MKTKYIEDNLCIVVLFRSFFSETKQYKSLRVTNLKLLSIYKQRFQNQFRLKLKNKIQLTLCVFFIHFHFFHASNKNISLTNNWKINYIFPYIFEKLYLKKKNFTCPKLHSETSIKDQDEFLKRFLWFSGVFIKTKWVIFLFLSKKIFYSLKCLNISSKNRKKNFVFFIKNK